MRGLPIVVLLAELLAAVESQAQLRSQPALYPDRELDSGLGPVADLTFAPDGRLLAAVGESGGLGIWDAQTGDLVRKATVGRSALLRATVGAAGNVVAVGGEDGAVHLLDLRTGAAREVARHPKRVTALALSANGWGASGDAAGGLLLWDLQGGRVGALEDEGHRKAILHLAFDAQGALTSLSQDLRIVTWDVAGGRPVRRGSLQFESTGRTAVPESASGEGSGAALAVSAQYLITPRGGALAARRELAHPEDLRRVNVIVPYAVATGTSSDPVNCGDFKPERLALSPGGCLALFTSSSRGQPRLHAWSLVEKGEDLVRMDLTERPSALALDALGGRLAAGFSSGRIRTWRVSGATLSDCDASRRRGLPGAGEPRIALGSESAPLIPAGAGYRIAVLRFEAGGLEGFLAEALREMVAGELANSPHVVVAERSAIDGIVKELELQRSGLTAADAARIGRGLNARKVLFGNVSRFGAGSQATYVILVRVVDVETQRVEGTRQVTCENCVEKDLPRAVETLRRAIVQ